VRETPRVDPTSPESATWKQLIVVRKLEIGDSFEDRMWLDHVYYVVFGIGTAILFAIWWPPGIALSLFVAGGGILTLLARIRYGSRKLRDLRRLFRGDPPVISPTT
jgi:hypothetical protein